MNARTVSFVSISAAARSLGSRVLLGAGLGGLVLGVGGRVVMRAIALVTDTPAAWTVGGTVTVIAAGVASGAGGALLHAAAHATARRLAPRWSWAGPLLFLILLGLVTIRGLRGTPGAPSLMFVPLVVAYAVAFERVAARRQRPAATAAANRDPSVAL